ncbi:hypothetical protein [Kitasatospora sp. DSM 101779]|uniref:hypothetical protein n=1 Tax=Kitasatospora sp. DSM 101779 TaxID=2853165 RepID=UPI0021D889BD|nr:hypothetical protein [Kitasatospora sp. DSM 101779]MCU7820131.1 hypothetical protein [Kitasatospora sp. DSM 101779]
MSASEVEDALGRERPDVSTVHGWGEPVVRMGWQEYLEEGVAAFYGQDGRLVAVAVGGLGGPQVRAGDVELIGRVPSEVRADVLRLAGGQRVAVRTNGDGDPEVAAWGVSLGTVQELGRTPEGWAQRRDRMVTDALLVAAELADDPRAAEPVVRRRGVRDEDRNPGVWPVVLDFERPIWEWTPLEGVGPLRFGMGPEQVSAALGGEVPAARRGRLPWTVGRGPRQWCLEEDRFDHAGVSAHYWGDVPTLAAVTVHGRTGPQVAFHGIDLIGRQGSAIDAALLQLAEIDEIGLRLNCAGDLGPDELNMYVRATRAGDAVISEARFCTAGWEEHG